MPIGDVLGTNPKTPTPRNLSKEMTRTLNTQIALAPKEYAAESEWAPQYEDLGLQLQGQTRSGNLAQASALTPQMRAVIRQWNPEATGLLDTLNNQAQQQLAQNGALDPWTERAVQQYVRGGQAARGMGYGPGDVMMEAQYEGQTTEQRRAQNQQLAASVAAGDQAYYGDPFSRAAQVTGVQGPPQLFNPESSYAQDLYNTNYNADAAAKIAAANNNAALWGSVISTVGKVAGAAAV